MIEHGGKRVLITGASRGFGRAVAEALAGKGWRLIIDARGEESLSEVASELSKLTEVIAIAGDVSVAAHRSELHGAAEKMGGLDAIINNAGILGPSPQPHLLDYPLDALKDVYRMNVLAPLAVIQAMKDLIGSGATIINVTSDAAVEAYPGWGGYGSSKAALEQISAVLAAENPDLNIYRFDPGDMRTAMHQEAFPGEDISDRPLPETSVPALLRLIEGELPSGRYRASELLEAPVAEEAMQ
jgi:NAD(P)-dependent dehydrogenase (short-subunit alcohol dehydrogenase family)